MTIFDFVKSNLSILDIVSEYVRLKPVGNYYKGPCPFHTEKEASFTVSPEKQIFYCFGCHAGGDLISFISKSENLTQIESVNFLVDKYGLTVPDEIKKSSPKDSKKSMEEKELWFKVNEAIAAWSYEKLLKTPVALNYLKERDIDLKTANYFNIGYFPGGTLFINSFLKDMSSNGIMLKDLIEVGFLQQSGINIFSPFEERILFPIKDVLGRALGFGGRIFRQNDDRAKYYNSKDSDWFSKGKILFGLDKAKKDLQKKGYGFLVEGYTDCVAMVQHGYANVVATLGTACTAAHLKMLSRYVNELFILYDGDDAGQKAILRLTTLCWQASLDLKVVKLPATDDPASFLRKVGGKYNFVGEAKDIFSFFIDSIGQDFLNKTLSEKLKLSEKIVQTIAQINNVLKRDLLLQQASSVTRIPFDSLKGLLKSFLQKNDSYQHSFDKHQDTASLSNFEEVGQLEEKIFSAIINSLGKKNRFWIGDDLIQYFSVKIQFLLNKLDVFVKDCALDNVFQFFIDSLDQDDKKWVLQVSLKFEENISYDYFEQLILSFRKMYWKQILQNIRIEILKAKQKGDGGKLITLFEKYSKLKKEIQGRGLI